MIWEVHEGGTQKDAPSHTAQAPVLSNAGRPVCAQCSRYTATFMLRAADAAEQVTLKPDDQIWLALFGALQELLSHRTHCPACDQLETNGLRSQPPLTDDNVSRASQPAVR